MSSNKLSGIYKTYKSATEVDNYNNALSYSIGDLVIYNNNFWKCHTAVVTPEDFDSGKWTLIGSDVDKYTQTEVDSLLDNKAALVHGHDISDLPSELATEAEVIAAVDAMVESHNHDDLYYTETEIDNTIDGLFPDKSGNGGKALTVKSTEDGFEYKYSTGGLAIEYKDANFTAETNMLYYIDSTGEVTITLPATFTEGQYFEFFDYLFKLSMGGSDNVILTSTLDINGSGDDLVIDLTASHIQVVLLNGEWIVRNTTGALVKDDSLYLKLEDKTTGFTAEVNKIYHVNSTGGITINTPTEAEVGTFFEIVDYYSLWAVGGFNNATIQNPAGLIEGESEVTLDIKKAHIYVVKDIAPAVGWRIKIITNQI